MKSVWVLGEGPVTVDKQFLTDYKRVNMTLNSKPMPRDTREGIRLLYDTCGTKYYMYTKYMNQTVGNMAIEILRKMYPHAHIVATKNSFVVEAYTRPHRVRCRLICNLHNDDLSVAGNVLVTLTFDLDSYLTTITVKDSFRKQPRTSFRQTL